VKLNDFPALSAFFAFLSHALPPSHLGDGMLLFAISYPLFPNFFFLPLLIFTEKRLRFFFLPNRAI